MSVLFKPNRGALFGKVTLFCVAHINYGSKVPEQFDCRLIIVMRWQNLF